MKTEISGFIIETKGGVLFGPFAKAEEAAEWIDDGGRMYAGPFVIRVVTKPCDGMAEMQQKLQSELRSAESRLNG